MWKAANAQADQHDEVDATKARRRDTLLIAGICGIACIGLTMIVWPRPPLWLDEAQSVAIARRSLPGLVDGLRADGAPPIYYVLLHGWMQVFGHGDVAVRSLSILFALAALFCVPLGLEAESLLSAADDPAAIADRGLARAFDRTVAELDVAMRAAHGAAPSDWIPACAGMTIWQSHARCAWASAKSLDPRLRGDDDLAKPCALRMGQIVT